MANKIPIALSNKHLHISQEHLEILFGEGYELTKSKTCPNLDNMPVKKSGHSWSKGYFKGLRILGRKQKNTN